MAKKESEKFYNKTIKEFQNKYGLSERRFLNKGVYHSTGSVVGIIRVDNPHYVYANLYLTDCSRQISLDLDIDSKKDRKNSIFKLNQLIEVCEAMKANIRLLEEYSSDKKKFVKKYDTLRDQEAKKKK